MGGDVGMVPRVVADVLEFIRNEENRHVQRLSAASEAAGLARSRLLEYSCADPGIRYNNCSNSGCTRGVEVTLVLLE